MIRSQSFRQPVPLDYYLYNTLAVFLFFFLPIYMGVIYLSRLEQAGVKYSKSPTYEPSSCEI